MTGGPFERTTIAVCVLRDGRIVEWRDVFEPVAPPAEDLALWRRLRRARW